MRTLPRRKPELTWPILLLVPAIFVTLMGYDTTVRSVTREAKPLTYVGQVQLGEPANEGGRIVVPLKYVGGEWGQNSAIVPIDVESTVKEAEIEMTVISSVATDNDANEGYELILPEDSYGRFTVYYRDPDGRRHQIGEVQVTE